jgi:hypothetical protein
MAGLGEKKRPILGNAEEKSIAAEREAADRRDADDERAREARRNEQIREHEPRRAEDVRHDEARRAENGQPTEAHRAAPHNGDDKLSPLLADSEGNEFRSRWEHIQAGFVDEPRRAVEQADELVAETMQRLARSFAEQKKTLETQWARSEQVSTEDLRMAFRRYRSFFDRLLSL